MTDDEGAFRRWIVVVVLLSLLAMGLVVVLGQVTDINARQGRRFDALSRQLDRRIGQLNRRIRYLDGATLARFDLLGARFDALEKLAAERQVTLTAKLDAQQAGRFPGADLGRLNIPGLGGLPPGMMPGMMPGMPGGVPPGVPLPGMPSPGMPPPRGIPGVPLPTP